jgi:DNA repair exonuclease SbcCD nuclease subunit
MKNVKNIKIVDQVIEENDFILCPYVYPGRFIEALETKTKNWMSKKIIFAHQEFKGCKMGAIDSIEGDDWKEEFPIVVSGHIHDNQKIGKNVYYPGSPLQHSFGDSETRVLCDISIENDEKEVIINDIPLNVPKKKIMRIEKNDFKDIKKIMTKISQDDVDKVKLKLDITTDEFNLFKKSKEYSELMNKGIKVQLMKKKNENKDDKIEKNENKDMNFNVILENMIKNDEEMVKDLYHEVVLGIIRL